MAEPTNQSTDALPAPRQLNFIQEIIEDDLKSKKHDGAVHTRFPPEPNGYLHIGHAKSICLNFGLARDYNGLCNLRFDDTNPAREDVEYVDSIKEDIRWLGFDWGEREYYASDYFERLYQYAVALVKKGRAYVCDLSGDDIRKTRGSLTEPGTESPYRDRPVEENLDLFARMRAGEFPDGSRTLRAKIDMSAPNINLRDPIMYRILRAEHHRTGNAWCIYPTYDWAHGQSDSLEQITHSVCTLEFEDHRPLYDWFISELGIVHPQQIEFARLNLTYTVMSKRKMLQLVEGGYVDGWDDPRMLTISGLRRRGYTPASLRNFCGIIGLGKKESWIDMGVLENAVRDDLNISTARVMCVLDPVKIIIDNYPEDQVEDLEAMNHPQNPDMGSRRIPFSRELSIERSDFMENPCPKFHRLGPGREVRLRYGYLVKCVSYVKDSAGLVQEIHCTYDPATRGGSTPDGRKVKGTIHWVSTHQAVSCPVRLYDRLFLTENPEAEKDIDFKAHLNPESRICLDGAMAEPSLMSLAPGTQVQFERQGYFSVDPVESTPGKPVFNRIVTLRDTWIKQQQR